MKVLSIILVFFSHNLCFSQVKLNLEYYEPFDEFISVRNSFYVVNIGIPEVLIKINQSSEAQTIVRQGSGPSELNEIGQKYLFSTKDGFGIYSVFDTKMIEYNELGEFKNETILPKLAFNANKQNNIIALITGKDDFFELYEIDENHSFDKKFSINAFDNEEFAAYANLNLQQYIKLHYLESRNAFVLYNEWTSDIHLIGLDKTIQKISTGNIKLPSAHELRTKKGTYTIPLFDVYPSSVMSICEKDGDLFVLQNLKKFTYSVLDKMKDKVSEKHDIYRHTNTIKIYDLSSLKLKKSFKVSEEVLSIAFKGDQLFGLVLLPDRYYITELKEISTMK